MLVYLNEFTRFKVTSAIVEIILVFTAWLVVKDEAVTCHVLTIKMNIVVEMAQIQFISQLVRVSFLFSYI